MLLRLKGERRDEDILAEDEGDLDLDDRTDRIQPESVFPEEGGADTGADSVDDEEQAEEEEGGWPLRGLTIAGATFVPTFLAIVFGLPYLFVPGDAPRAAVIVQPPPITQRQSAPVAPAITPSEPLRRSPAASETGKAPSSESAKQQDEARPAVESTLSAPSPALPPIQPQVADPARPPVPVEPALPSRSAPKPRVAASEPPAPKTLPPPKESRAATVKESVAATKETPPVREGVVKDTTGWTPAAAFADRAAAQRLASGIEQQGYPVEIRQDGSSTRPWVVWIGGQPRNNGGQRRR